MAPADPSTDIDPQGRRWHIDDAVMRLRLWGAEYAHRLPEPRDPLRLGAALTGGPLKLGSAPTCELRLHDKAGLLSREHAELTPEPTGWEIRDMADLEVSIRRIIAMRTWGVTAGAKKLGLRERVAER